MGYRVLVATIWQVQHYCGVDLSSLPATAPVTAVPIVSGATVAVETLLLGMRDGRLTYRATQQDLADNEHPDAAALRLACFDGDTAADGRVLHSTSWRFAAGRIVLTYAALPDPDPSAAAVLRAPAAPAIGLDPVTPSPPHVAQADVVMHACRHLAFLRHTDPVVADASRLHPPLWRLLERYGPDVAGLRPVRATRA